MRTHARTALVAALALALEVPAAARAAGAPDGAEPAAAREAAIALLRAGLPASPREAPPPALTDCGAVVLEAGDVNPACLPGVPASRGAGSLELERPARARGPLPEGHLVPLVESSLITLVMLGWNATIGAAPWARVSEDTIGRNLRSSWVLDDDQFWVNQVGHPYQGVFHYGAARSAGLGFWASAPYPFVTSAIWEVVGETTPPSVNDQVTTTVAGIVLGEALHRVTGLLLEGSRGPGRAVTAALITPMEAINRGLVGTEPYGPAPPARVQLRAGALVFDPRRDRPGAEGPVPELGVRIGYGLPGDPDFRFDRPFDRFELESTYSTEKDPLATVLARGVVAGRALAGERVRGLLGVSLGFDFSALRRYSVSTSTLGLSAEGRWDVAPGVAVEGVASASAVLLGAAGYLSGLPEERRSYRMGPGGQAHVDLEVLALDRLAARVTARHYLIAGAGSLPGTERVSTAAAGLEVRVAGPHAIGLEGRLAHHAGEAGSGAPARSETGTELRAYYAFTARKR